MGDERQSYKEPKPSHVSNYMSLGPKRVQPYFTAVIESTSDGVIISVRVIPRASKSGVAGTRADELLVRLHAPPVEGAANAELIELIAAALEVPKRAVSIVAGEHSRHKRVRVAGIDLATAQQKFASFLPVHVDTGRTG